MQSSLDEIGLITECRRSAEEMFAGQGITEENLNAKPIPKFFMTSSFVTDKTRRIGEYFKIALAPGTSITGNCNIPKRNREHSRKNSLKCNGAKMKIRVISLCRYSGAKEWFTAGLFPKNAVVMLFVNRHRPEIAAVARKHQAASRARA